MKSMKVGKLIVLDYIGGLYGSYMYLSGMSTSVFIEPHEEDPYVTEVTFAEITNVSTVYTWCYE